jgi:fructose-1,6-bisphosphatase II
VEPQVRGSTPSFEVRRELALDLVRATEKAALAGAREMGKGDQEVVRLAAGQAMRQALDDSGLTGTVQLGPRNDASLAYSTVVGEGAGRAVDLGVYPVEGASLVARGVANAVSFLVAVETGTFPVLPAVWYVEKFVAGPEARGAIDLDDPIADNLRRIAFARDVRVQDLTVAILDRPRHEDLISEVAAAGARVLTLEEGDIGGSVMAAVPGSGIDASIGIGGLQETVMAACAIRCLGGEIQARPWARNDEERALIGADNAPSYGVADLSPANVGVAITGITGGQLLPGVWFGSRYAETTSLLLSSRQATIRRMTTRHHAIEEPHT